MKVAEGLSKEINNLYKKCTVQLEPISPEEVSERIVQLKPRKAPGPDGVMNSALHRLPERGIQFLSELFNVCLRLAYFPAKWKTATVIVIPKPGKNSSRAENLRPISLLSATSKIFERLIQRRIRVHLERLDVVIPCLLYTSRCV